MFNENLLLTNQTAIHLYNQYAKDAPIIDYHCHLSIQEIADDQPFENLGEIWLALDHYKWRAMRTFGIDEELITGGASYHDKFIAFARILPYLAGNPLSLWCSLELRRYFDIEEPLCAQNAEAIFEQTSGIIRENRMSPSYILNHSNLLVASTTEDPADDLFLHFQVREQARFSPKILPAFRPDSAFYIEKSGFAAYLKQLGDSAGIAIHSMDTLAEALENRLLNFKRLGSVISDHGIERYRHMPATKAKADEMIAKAQRGEPLTPDECDQYKTRFLLMLGELYHRHGFVFQLHIGTYQGANRHMESKIGKATGFDCTDDNTPIGDLGSLLEALSSQGCLGKTILYPLNPTQIETYAILAAAFCDDGVPGKVQLGAPWWFNDQVYGIDRQLQAAGNLYPLSLSVGMLTDSRNYLSFTRHEVYRRVLCDYFGKLIERGEYCASEATLKEIILNICYLNAARYFGIPL